MAATYTVKTSGAPTARADYLCARCFEAGTMAEPVTLPVNAKRCPVCGRAKWLERVWTPPHVATGVAKRVDAMVGPEYARQQRARDDAKAQERQAPSLAVPVTQLSSTLAQWGVAAPAAWHKGEAKPTATVTDPALAGMKGAGMTRPVTGPRQHVDDHAAWASTGGTRR